MAGVGTATVEVKLGEALDQTRKSMADKPSRKTAILATKIEDALAWAQYANGKADRP